MQVCSLFIFKSLLLPLIAAQGPVAGVYGQINLPELLRSLQPAAAYPQGMYPTWQLPSPYRYTPYDPYGWENSRYYPLPYSPYSYPDYGNNIQPVGNRGPMDMQDLIGDLSLSLMRSFTNILGGNNNILPNSAANAISSPVNRQPYYPPYTPPDLYGYGNNNGQSLSSSNYGYRPRYGPANYGSSLQAGYSSSPSSSSSFPFAQPASLPYPPGKSQSEFGYGVNAGVYAGTFGGNTVVGPTGPYGLVNNNVGSSYGGLSPWPSNPGNNWGSQRPQPIVPINSGSNNSSSNNQTPGSPTEQQTSAPIQTGTGTVRQIPLTEGLTGTNVAVNNSGGGGAELLMPATPPQV